MEGISETEAELREALRNLYELCNDERFGRGWARGDNTMRMAEIALGYLPRKSPYPWVDDFKTEVQNG